MPLSEMSAADMAAVLLDLSSRLLARVRKDLPVNGMALPAGNDEHGGSAVLAKPGPGQFRLLRVLLTRERTTMQELATLLDVAPPTVTGLIKRLLAQGYVARVHDETDWRNIWIQITEQGRQAITYYDQQRIATLQQRIEHLSSEEQDRLQAVFPVLLHILEEEL
ncbi:MAG TPA: MarR family transcriptional regulator [Ktedonobacteraceae bacterium]|nr:MarR family transcriptional regulator [Ktedonobacteraceae bacterium]